MLISRCFFLTAFFVSFGVKASTICVGHYVGNNVGFTSSFVGDQFNKVNIKTHGRWNGGGQDSLYKSLRDFAGFSSYSVAVPKQISLPGSSVQLTLTLSGNVITVPIDNRWQAVFVQQTNEGCAVNTQGVWQQVHVGIRAGQVNIALSGNGLPSGRYQLDVPYILAWGSSTDGNANRDFQDTWKAGNVGTSNVTGYFSLEFTIKNKCEITSVNNELVLKHGTMTPDVVSGSKVISKELSLSCETPTGVRFQFQPQKVDLGNGVSSRLTLKISDREYSDNPVSAVIDNSKLRVISTLQGKPGAAGELYGVSVLTALYD
ncbi:hypothetical protein QP300_11020 [Escherichia coli]|nr:hypothetical protein [Escherichia coli]